MVDFFALFFGKLDVAQNECFLKFCSYQMHIPILKLKRFQNG